MEQWGLNRHPYSILYIYKFITKYFEYISFQWWNESNSDEMNQKPTVSGKRRGQAGKPILFFLRTCLQPVHVFILYSQGHLMNLQHTFCADCKIIDCILIRNCLKQFASKQINKKCRIHGIYFAGFLISPHPIDDGSRGWGCSRGSMRGLRWTNDNYGTY